MLTPCSSNPPSVEFNEDRPNPQETEDCGFGTSQNVEIDGNDMIEEPKKGMQYVTLAYACGGKARNRTFNIGNPRSTGKTECKAKINALRSDGKLRLTTVHNIHNHGLSPKKSRFFRCNREVSGAVKRVLDTNDMVGVRMNKRFGSLVVGTSGFENLQFLEKDCRNYIDKARHLRLGAVPEKLGSYSSYKTGMKSALMKCVYDSQIVEEFETSWDQLITTYNLHKNAWLQSLYAEREHWVPAFLKDYFWAGMSTTQRSESMNAFFDGSLIEKRFQELYTNSKFKEVQQQVTGMIDINPKLQKSDGAVKTYLVNDEVHLEEFTKLVTYSVDFSEEDSFAKCSCGLFQMRGILCRHILAKELTQDVKAKLYGMIDLYRANQEPPSMTQTGSNVGCTRGDATTVGGSGQVRSPNIVRRKGRPPSLRRASRMEKDM
ncbi:hypothetical protein EZV62_012280 [Acer yangbiense]|uniref:Protein FAR1-RELATED SEQUENCE n=1 Tax=Acer yangbiense TaxID=1000413 RepID=A0A5C7HUZ7_9ROSI|nr:hypothetical protein EZV62_012280 [Acer yangbiense]